MFRIGVFGGQFVRFRSRRWTILRDDGGVCEEKTNWHGVCRSLRSAGGSGRSSTLPPTTMKTRTLSLLLLSLVLASGMTSLEAHAQRGSTSRGDSTRVVQPRPTPTPSRNEAVREQPRREEAARPAPNRGATERTPPRTTPPPRVQEERAQPERPEPIRVSPPDQQDPPRRTPDRQPTQPVQRPPVQEDRRTPERQPAQPVQRPPVQEDRRTPQQPSPGDVRGNPRGATEGQATSGRLTTRDARYYPFRDQGRAYVAPHYNPNRYRSRPVARVDVFWPWEARFNNGWSPRYVYRQVIRTDDGFGWQDNRFLEIRTTYRQRVLGAGPRFADVEVRIERLEVFEDGYYLGRVTRFPSRFSQIQARIDRSGRIVFDGDLSLVGNSRVGFELVRTRHYGGFVYSHWRRGHELDVARVNLRGNRVESVRWSRLFDPFGRDGFPPFSILPDNNDWLLDFGPFGLSSSVYDSRFDDPWGYSQNDRYFYGSGNQRNTYPQFDQPYALDGGQVGFGSQDQAQSPVQPPRMQQQNEEVLSAPSGQQFRIQREREVQRLQ
jgi:hypothetical protein